MKPHQDNDKEEILLTFHDLVNIIKTKRRAIIRTAVVFAAMAAAYALTKPIVYEGEATFKEKKTSGAQLSNYLSSTMTMLTGGGQVSDAKTMMQSRKLVEELIKSEGLQGNIVKSEYRFQWIPFETIRDNILTEYALFTNAHFPIVKDPAIDLKTTEVVYHKETPSSYLLRPVSDNHYDILDTKKNLLGTGVYGISFAIDDISFTVVKLSPNDLKGEEYHLVLFPLSKTAKLLAKQFILETDKDDSSLIKITHLHRNRNQAADNVNILMSLYQKHIQKEHADLCKLQSEYLVAKQDEMSQQLKAMMHEYAKELSSELSTTGFTSTEKAMEFLASNQQSLKQQLFTINIEIQRLENAQLDPSFDGELFSSTGKLDIFNKIAAEKRSLMQLYDSLNLAIRSGQDDPINIQEMFTGQLHEQEQNKQLISDSAAMLYSLEHNEVPRSFPSLINNSKFIVKEWYVKFLAAQEHFNRNASSIEAFESWQNCKDGFCNYLSRLNHYLKVNQRNIEERLANQQISGANEFQGINLNIAKELYISYTKELCELESSCNELNFIILQIDEPNFEISSLSTTLKDPVSIDMINSASNLILTLKDHENRSIKEQERMHADLAIQKKFLKDHLQQSITLSKLRQDLIRKKIKELQNTNFLLVQEEISILESQLKEYLSSALENLGQEQALLTQNLAELRLEMATFPQKWTAEQLISHQMDINKTLIEEISKLVESKNVSDNLEKTQSAPVDHAFPPLHPKSPRILLLTILGGIFGAFISFISLLTVSVVKGIKAIPQTLQSAGLNIAGSLSKGRKGNGPLLDSDLETLRRLITLFCAEDSVSKTIALIEGNEQDYAEPLAELITRKGLKVLIVDLHFDKAAEGKTPGMLQYLEGKAQEPAIVHHNRFDSIPSGGICRYGSELISSKRFRDILKTLEGRYDCVIISSNARPASAETESLLDIVPKAAISVADETIDDLQNVVRRARDPKSMITFIFVA